MQAMQARVLTLLIGQFMYANVRYPVMCNIQTKDSGDTGHCLLGILRWIS